jgi:MOSC domain-containing protein YiiM
MGKSWAGAALWARAAARYLQCVATNADPGRGTIVEINISPEHKRLPEPVPKVRAAAGRGLEGDRNCLVKRSPRPNRMEDLTLIATEALEALRAEHGIELSPAESRRNVATRGIDLNGLVGKRFRVGETECLGMDLCEPCNGLQRMTQPGVLKGLVHRAGIYASILSDGEISVGDTIEVLDA